MPSNREQFAGPEYVTGTPMQDAAAEQALYDLRRVRLDREHVERLNRVNNYHSLYAEYAAEHERLPADQKTPEACRARMAERSALAQRIARDVARRAS